nr:hypothetical protein [Tanacetum cinerariifolium]
MKSYIDNLERLGHPVSLGLVVSLILISPRKDFDSFVQNYNMHSMEKTMNELHAMLKPYEQTLPKNNAPALHAIRAGKVQKGNTSIRNCNPNWLLGDKIKGKGKNKLTYAPKTKIPPPPKREDTAKDSICHQCGETGHWKRICPWYLAKLLKNKKLSQEASGLSIFIIKLYNFPNKSWVYDTGYGTHICNTPRGLRGSRKLKPSTLILYVGNGHRAAVEAIGSYHLSLPSELVIVLNNFHYAPSITRGIILVSRLYDDGYANHFVDNSIQVYRNNMFYFSVVPRDGIFEIDLSDSYTNGSSMIMGLSPIVLLLKRFDRGSEFMIRSMMSQTTLPKSFWDYALETAARILNMVPTEKVEKTPYEVWHGQAPKLSYLQVCLRFLITQEASVSLEDLEIIQEKDMHPFIDTSLNHEEDDIEIDEPQSDIIPIRRSTRTRHSPDRLYLYIDVEEHGLGDLGVPANYKAALLDPESDKWLNDMNVEMQSMKDNEVWALLDLPPNGKIVGSKWLFKKKTDMDGAVHTYKVGLVVKGYTQTSGIDYEETFSHVVDIRAIRILIAIAAFYDYEIWQMDVKTAFLNGYLSEEVYMEQPEGFVNPKYPNRVCKMKRSIYGLKQASRQLNKRFDDEIKKFGFTQNHDKPCVYLQASRNLDEAAYNFEIKIYKDRSWRLIGLCQSSYNIEKILKRYHMDNSKCGSIPMQDKLGVIKSQGASTSAKLKRIQNVPYASAVGSIMYAVRCTRSDVAFA